MANRKKKKKTPQHSLIGDFKVSKTYFDKFSDVARKTLLLLDLDADLYDRFTKKQKIEMMRAKMTIPRITVKEGHSVPRQYVSMVQQDMYLFMKNWNVSNEKTEILYYDLIIYGFTFLMFMKTKHDCEDDCEQSDAYRLIGKKAVEVDAANFNENLLKELLKYINSILLGVSKINFRIYGFDWKWKILDNMYKAAGHVVLTSENPQKYQFNYQNNVRPAFRVFIGQFLSAEPTYVNIPYNKIITESNQTYPLEVYIQNHALNRIKERLNVLHPVQKNAYLYNSLTDCEVCLFDNGQLVIKYIGDNNKVFGYLPFTIIDKKLLVLSFLPITAVNTPEYNKLKEILNISKEETEFLGMDKLSFFLETDFDAIPRLKKAVEASGLWHLTDIETSFDYEKNKKVCSPTLTRFFQNEEKEYDKEEILKEIEERY